MLQRLPRRQKNVSVFDFSIQDACCRITSLMAATKNAGQTLRYYDYSVHHAFIPIIV